MKKRIDLNSLIRPNILELKPYRSARDDFNSGILLDANENSFGAPFEDDLDLNRYPMPYQEELRTTVADFRGVETQNVFVGVGSDEAIDLLFRIFCQPGKDKVLILPPTYGMYKVSAAINDISVDEILLTPDFQIRVNETLNAVTENTKIIFLCSPNNPTANNLKKEDISSIIDNFNGIVVVDEAYIDFSEQDSLAKDVLEKNNLVVLQTMSKSFGLAGIRLGIAMADPEIISYMMKVKAPYNVNKLTSRAALKGFDNISAMKAKVNLIKSERERVITRLNAIPQIEKVFSSDTNFLVFRIPGALNLYQRIAAEGVVIRYRGNEPHCKNCLRLTIGTPAENDRFFEVLEKILAE